MRKTWGRKEEVTSEGDLTAVMHQETLQHPRTAKAPCTRLSSASLQLEHTPKSFHAFLTESVPLSCPSSEGPQTTFNALVAGWQCPGEDIPGRISKDMAQLADVPAGDRRTKASSFHSDRHEFKEAKRLRPINAARQEESPSPQWCQGCFLCAIQVWKQSGDRYGDKWPQAAEL